MNKEDTFALDDFLPYLLNQAAERAGQAFAQVYKDKYGISRTEWRIMAHLGAEDPLTASEIAKRANLDRSKISRAVFALEERGWLVRERDADDRRQEQLSLTSAGRATYLSLSREAVAHQKSLMRQLGDENTRALVAALNLLRR